MGTQGNMTAYSKVHHDSRILLLAFRWYKVVLSSQNPACDWLKISVGNLTDSSRRKPKFKIMLKGIEGKNVDYFVRFGQIKQHSIQMRNITIIRVLKLFLFVWAVYLNKAVLCALRKKVWAKILANLRYTPILSTLSLWKKMFYGICFVSMSNLWREKSVLFFGNFLK